MTTQEYTNLILLNPRLRSLPDGIDIGDIRNLVESLIPIAANRIAVAHDFPFVRASSSTTTVADTATYTLTGASGDCRDVVAITYGDDRKALEEISSEEYERDYSDVDLPYAVEKWLVEGGDGRQVNIRLVGTPTEVKTLTYRYLRSTINPEEVPDAWVDVMTTNVMGMIFPDMRKAALEEIQRMIQHYDKGDIGPAPIAGEWRTRNVARNQLHGF